MSSSTAPAPPDPTPTREEKKDPGAKQEEKKTDEQEVILQAVETLYEDLDEANQVRLFLRLADYLRAGVFWHWSAFPHVVARWGSAPFEVEADLQEKSALCGSTAVAYNGARSRGGEVYDRFREGGLDGNYHPVRLHGEDFEMTKYYSRD